MNGKLISKKKAGLTLVELIVAIVIVSIAVTGVLLVMNATTGRSADPLLQHQATAIGEAYLEEILLKSFSDPDGIDGEATRSLFDDVSDYNGLSDTGARDQSGAAIAGLDSYRVDVSVVHQEFGGIPAADAKRVTVKVTDPTGASFDLQAYRVNSDGP